MKIKKSLVFLNYFILIFALGVIFLLNVKKTIADNGENCSNATGQCKTSCGSNETSWGEMDCPLSNNTVQYCCYNSSGSSNSCTSYGGSCKDSCGSSETDWGQMDCTTAHCCYDSSGGTSSNNTSSGNTTTTSFPNPLNYSSVSDVLSAVLTNIQSIVATLAVIFVVIGGIMYMVSAGDPSITKRAKSTIAGALIGLAIVLAAPTFLKEVRSILGATGSSGNSSVDSASSLTTIASNVLKFLLSIVGVLGIISLVIGGLMYLSSYGSDDQIKTAKKIINFSLIGITVALAALIIVKQVGSLIGG